MPQSAWKPKTERVPSAPSEGRTGVVTCLPSKNAADEALMGEMGETALAIAATNGEPFW